MMRCLALLCPELFLWLLLVSHAHAYYLGPSCYKYSGAGLDLSFEIKKAMEEAQTLPGLGKEGVRQWEYKDPMDNSKDQLFPEAEEEDFWEAYRAYAKFS
jgi:hypothetical protein